MNNDLGFIAIMSVGAVAIFWLFLKGLDLYIYYFDGGRKIERAQEDRFWRNRQINPYYQYEFRGKRHDEI